MIKTGIKIFKLINNPLTKMLFNLVLGIAFTFYKIVFSFIIGPLSFFLIKKSFKRAFTKTLPKMVVKYFKFKFPKMIKGKVKKTFPINMILKFIE